MKDLQPSTAISVEGVGNKKELETKIPEKTCQTQSQKGDEEAHNDDKAGNAENDLF